MSIAKDGRLEAPPAGTGAMPRKTTRHRIFFAFSAVLGLFAVALVVILLSLSRIAAAESEVARLDHAKHAGHEAAALAREQYIHQAHTLIEWDHSHLGHYTEVADAARSAAERLRNMVISAEGRRQADEIASLVAESHDVFRAEVIPAVAANQHDQANELHHKTEALLAEVIQLNDSLNAALEARSAAAQARAADIRGQARIIVLSCFALAIVLAAAVGAYLLRSISRPIAILRAGVERAGAGNLEDEILLDRDDEFSELAHAFNQMTRDLSSHQAELIRSHRLASIGQVASGVAHEVNNPLGVILGYTKVLRSDPALRDRDELVIIEEEVRQCQHIVAGLLDLARPVNLHISELDLGDLVREVAGRLEESGQSTGVRIRVPEAPATPVRGDEVKLKQIILNLLLNAIEAARDEGSAGDEVTVEWQTDGNQVRLHVLDCGPGIPDEAVPSLFEPFFTTKASGHGLGLAMARTLAQAHGGDVTIAPRGNAGTVASLHLPQEPSAGAQPNINLRPNEPDGERAA